MLELLSHPFLYRMFIAGLLLSITAALIGVTLVLKRYAMIGDGLSHTAFGAAALAGVLNFSPLYVAIPVVIIAAILLLRVEKNVLLSGDSSIAVLSTGSLALGVMLISLNHSMVDINQYFFGSLLAVGRTELIITVVCCIVAIVLYLLFYHYIFAVIFDEDFAKVSGISTKRFNMALAIITSVVIVLGMKIMGALLIASLIVIPAVSSMRVYKTFKAVTISSVIISVISLVVGVILSAMLGTPIGASVVTCDILIFLVMSVIRKSCC